MEPWKEGHLKKTIAPGKKESRLKATGVALVLPLILACGGDGDAARAQTPPTDSVLGAILETAVDAHQNAPRPTSPRIPPETQVQQPLKIAEMGYNYGSPEAVVKVLEVSDFGCGYCRRFHEETFPRLREIYVDEGYIEWKFIPFVLGMFPNGLEAATAGECAGEQGQFYPMKARLFADQSAWRTSDEPYSFFSRLAREEGLDVERFDQCIQGGWRDGQVRNNIRLGQQVGARGTPLFIIDGRLLEGVLPFRDFRAILDEALIQRGITPPPR
jgi:protein-disulfide isomerase